MSRGKQHQDWSPAPNLERRPATLPANARELALKSHARQLRREGLNRRAAEVMLAARSASGPAKGPAPRKRATSRKAPPRVSTTSYIEEAKLLRARLRSWRSVEEPAPFGAEWLIETPMDIGRAVRRVEAGYAAGKREAVLKQWIAKRAAEMNCSNLVPPGWATAQ